MPQSQEVNYTADVRCRENIARSHRNFQHKSVLQIFKIAQYHIWDAILATRGSLWKHFAVSALALRPFNPQNSFLSNHEEQKTQICIFFPKKITVESLSHFWLQVKNSRWNAFAEDVWSLDDCPSFATPKCAHRTCRRWGRWLRIRILYTPYASFNVLLSSSKKRAAKLHQFGSKFALKALLYTENYGRGLKIQCFVTLTELVTARLHQRSSSTFGNLDRMLDWIYIEFAMVIHFWVLHLVLVRRWESVKAPVVKAGTKRNWVKKMKERDFNARRAVETHSLTLVASDVWLNLCFPWIIKYCLRVSLGKPDSKLHLPQC